MKYKDEKDFVTKEFMQDLDMELFSLSEDKDNYYISYKDKKVITLYKTEMSKLKKDAESKGIKNKKE